MKKSQKSYKASPFLIGLFVIIGTVALIAVIIWLGASQILKENVNYVTYFDGSVEGLTTGSPVKYQGVPVGSVKRVSVAPDGRLIEIVMQIEKGLKVDDTIRVKEELSGIAGGRFLQLFYPTDSLVSNLNPEIYFKPPYRLIKSSPSGMDEMEIAARDVLNKLSQFRYKDVSQEMITFFNTSTSFFKNEELYGIISNLNNATLSVNNILAKVDTSNIVANLSITSSKLLLTSIKLDKFMDSLNNQINRMNLPARTNDLFTRYDTVMTNTNYFVRNANLRMETVLISLQESISSFKTSNKQFQKTLKAITENPAQMLFSEPPPQEK